MPPKKNGKPKATVVVVQPKARPKTFKQAVQRVTTSAGERIGSKIGGWVGDFAQKAISTITGLGDYKVKFNSIVAPTQGPPAFMLGGGCVCIAHREFLGVVSSPGSAFNITSYPLNPTAPVTFPWLSEIAYSFESFRFRGLVFEFKSTYGDAIASTNAALGSVILATQYNTTAPPFTTQVQMENYQFATSTKPSISMIHPVECDPSQLPLEHLYTYSSSNSDPRWLMPGTTYLATVGQQSAATIGELWVSYEIEFYQPKLLSGTPSSGLGGHYSGMFLSLNSFTTGVFPTTGTSVLFPIKMLSGDLSVSFLDSSGIGSCNTITFPPGLLGTFLIVIEWIFIGNGTGLTGSENTLTNPSVTNGNLLQYLPRPSTSSLQGGSFFGAAYTSTVSTNFAYGSGPSWGCCYQCLVQSTASVDTSCSVGFANILSGGTFSQLAGNCGVDVQVIAVPYSS